MTGGLVMDDTLVMHTVIHDGSGRHGCERRRGPKDAEGAEEGEGVLHPSSIMATVIMHHGDWAQASWPRGSCFMARAMMAHGHGDQASWPGR
jgi:hypothetical protein